MCGKPTNTQKLEAIFKVLGLKITWEDGQPDAITGDLERPDTEDAPKVVEASTRNVEPPPAKPPEDERHFVLGPRHRPALPPTAPANAEFTGRQKAFLDQLEKVTSTDTSTPESPG